MKQTYEVWSNNHYIETIGDEYQVREWFEEKLQEELGFFVMLQEYTEDTEFKIYLHSKNQEDLEDSELELLDEMGLDFFNDDKTWRVLQDFFYVYVYDNRHYPFTELNLKAKRTAVKEFLVDHEAFFRVDENDNCSFVEAYHTLLRENKRHKYDSQGILVSNGGMY
ncbi:hypothetical protein COJ96_10700 [Bacillus sp. AFS073361]|uniref:hypothetical protein n=1 Tax=Bacillus sp. AFS073361 TaxID=2033511 RepID=UPI000BF80D93|nr:hypothetical protein [Bacillus sp. AFS073361]PFP29365.1 hypothetical protein COJ96_10700 [Bacillus sp. AFS073361]